MTMSLFEDLGAILEPIAEPEILPTLDSILKEMRKIGTLEMSFSQFQEMQKTCVKCEKQIKMLINQLTIADLKKRFYIGSATTKKEMVNNVYDAIVSSFLLSESVSYMPFSGETYADALTKTLLGITETKYIIFSNKKAEDLAYLNKALTNPETLEEFNLFVQRKGGAALSVDQRAIYDDLITDSRRDDRSRNESYKNQVKSVEVSAGMEMEIKTSFHAKKKIDLWVVVLSSRVDGDQFNQLKDRAQKLGGYYSSYRGQGAIPGFTFENEKAADLFTEVKNGNVNITELKEQTEAERLLVRAETLEEKAGRIEEIATDSLNTERKDNTHRRAAMAASAERTALANIEFSQTITQIAERMKNGTIKYLDRLQNMTELETLMQIISSAKWRHIHKKNLKSDDYKITTETAEYVLFPYPSFYAKYIRQDLEKTQHESGKKLATARIIKNINRMKAEQEIYYCTSKWEIEDYETVLCSYSKVLDKYTRERYNRDLLRYKRVIRLNLHTPAELRAAIRELINIMSGVEVSPEQKRMQQLRDIDRQFIGKDIPGFFPTTATLSAEVVELAEIKPSNTICEPSAGLGHIAAEIREKHPDNELTCIEYNNSLYQALKVKLFDAINDDFLQHTATYDRIIMNPPFENGQDIDHVMKAWSLLNEGGRIVAIMAGNKGNQNQKTQDFVSFVQQHGSMHNNPAGAFLSSFRPTGVNTITVILDKKG